MDQRRILALYFVLMTFVLFWRSGLQQEPMLSKETTLNETIAALDTYKAIRPRGIRQGVRQVPAWKLLIMRKYLGSAVTGIQTGVLVVSLMFLRKSMLSNVL